MAAILFLKEGTTPTTSEENSPQDQLRQALESGQPTLVFIHSQECIPCKRMIGRVGIVYPEFADSVLLIDVVVYDEQNKPLLKELGVLSYPMLIFYDAAGDDESVVGVMEIEHRYAEKLAKGGALVGSGRKG